MVTILIPSSIPENRIPVLPPCFLRGIKAPPPPPPSHLALRERGWENGERRHYIKTNETANQTNMQNRHLYFLSVAKCRGSWVVGRGRGSWVWVWVNVVGKKKVVQKILKLKK